jgi:hypothetical protein
VRLARGGQPPVPQAAAPQAAAPAPPPVPLAPGQLTFPAQDVQQPGAVSQHPVQAQPPYQPQTPYQPRAYLQAQPPGQPVHPAQPQPVQPQPYPAPQGFQQPVYIQPAVYVQPWVYGPTGIQPVAYGQPGYPQPGYPQPAGPQPGPQPAGSQQAGLAGPPGMLAAAADRERAVDVLKAAFGEGRITKDEFDHRVSQVAQARTYADLGVVIADLPAGPLGGVSHYPGGLPAPTPYYPPVRQTTNGLAVGSLVCALLGISLPAVIMGHVARNQIRERNEGGDGLAIAGLVIGWLGIAFYALMFIAAIVAAGGGQG